MARLRDVSPVIQQLGLFTFLKRVWQQVGEDKLFTWGAALAYSWMFAAFPFLVLMLSLVPLLPDQFKRDIAPNVETGIRSMLTGDAADAIVKQANDVLSKETPAGGFLSFGLVLTIWAASGGMAMTMTALDIAYDIDKTRPYFRQRFIAIALTLVISVLIISVLVLLPIGNRVTDWLQEREFLSWIAVVALDIARYAIALVALFAILALVYHYGPSFKQKFHAISPGAVFCVAVWLLLGLAFRIYLNQLGGAQSYQKTYGAVAGAAILLLVFYIDALVLLVGAEINSELDFAVLGIPSGKTPEQQAIAPTETTNEPEQQALAEELKERRPEQEEGSFAPTSPTFAAARQPSPAVAKSGSGTSKLVAIAATMFAASKLIGAIKKKRDPDLDPRPQAQRLRETYPRTYEALKHDGDGRE